MTPHQRSRRTLADKRAVTAVVASKFAEAVAYYDKAADICKEIGDIAGEAARRANAHDIRVRIGAEPAKAPIKSSEFDY